MKLKGNRGIMAVMALSLCVIAGSAWANHEKKGDREFPSSKMVAELGLSQDQVKQIKSIREKDKKACEEKRNAVKTNHENLKTAMGKDTSDADLKKIFASLQDSKRALAEAKFDKMLEIRKVLTPEQRTKFKEFRGKHHHNHEHSEE